MKKTEQSVFLFKILFYFSRTNSNNVEYEVNSSRRTAHAIRVAA